MKKRTKIGLLAGLFSAFLLGGTANAEELSEKKIVPITCTLEERAKHPDLDFSFSYGIGAKQKETDYSKSLTTFINYGEGYIIRSSNSPELTSDEEVEVEKVIRDVKSGDINSYQDFAERCDDLSENQKLVLLSTIGDILLKFGYDAEMKGINPFSQDEFFKKMQDSLQSDSRDGLGACPQISDYVEDSARDIGFEVASVGGISRKGGKHVYVILKTEDGSAIIDYGKIIMIDSKNIEKLLSVYQKNAGRVAFQHFFVEDGEFKYRLITKDGKNFLDFVGFDDSVNSSKSYLTSERNSPSPHLSISFNLEDYLKSFEFNCAGIFVNIGEIKGDSNSPMNKAVLSQTGFRRKFLTPTFNNIYLNAILGNKIIDVDGSFMSGNILYEGSEDIIRGVNGNIIFATNNEQGFNLDFRTGLNSLCIPDEDKSFFESIFSQDFNLFYNFSEEAGISYKFKGEKMDMQPYLISQFWTYPDNNFFETKDKPMLSELASGVKFDFKLSDDTVFTLDPHHSWKRWEDEFGVEIGIRNDYVKASAAADATISKYEFCPDKTKLRLGLEYSLRNFIFGLDYKGEWTNYDGEIEGNNSLKVSTSFKY